MNLNNITNKGFTLVEAVLVIFLIGFLAGIAVPFYNKFQNSNNIELAAMELSQALRRAQILSQASSLDSNWGVYLSTGKITIFKGNNYLSRDSKYDENYPINNLIQISGLQEVVFNKFYSNTSNTGVINFNINANTSQAITINSRGTIDY